MCVCVCVCVLGGQWDISELINWFEIVDLFSAAIPYME